MRIYNSLSQTVEEFSPLKKNKVGLYTCGPTVYDFDHIGHGRKYTYDDVLKRVLLYQGYDVTHVQNITDVGHLSGDNDGDADQGVDRLEKGAVKYKKTPWEVAAFFTDAHFASMDKLNILRPSVSCKATDHITEQITLVQRLIEKGFAYDTPEAVYFDVTRFPRYDGLFGQHLLGKRVAVRDEVQTGDYKKNPVDFALWFKRVGRFSDHFMHWPSPWGDGFPGWHIECSAMGMKYLGETFDIHTGGEDHLYIHHPNEIAQSEAATGKPFVHYWLHYAFLTVDGQKMSKSLGNVYKVEDVIEKGFNPLALRYLYLTAHYRTTLNFTWSSLAAAQTALDKVYAFIRETRSQKGEGQRTELSQEKSKKLSEFQVKFTEQISQDLGFPQAIAVLWEMLKSNIPDFDKLDTLLDWDQILGLGFDRVTEFESAPEDIMVLVKEREQLRLSGKFVEADTVRMEIERKGWGVTDTKLGSKVTRLVN